MAFHVYNGEIVSLCYIIFLHLFFTACSFNNHKISRPADPAHRDRPERIPVVKESCHPVAAPKRHCRGRPAGYAPGRSGTACRGRGGCRGSAPPQPGERRQPGRDDPLRRGLAATRHARSAAHPGRPAPTAGPRATRADVLGLDRARAQRAARLLAECLDTAEVSGQLFYSERTVKNIIHDITSRLELRNRTHAVAHAIKAGLI